MLSIFAYLLPTITFLSFLLNTYQLNFSHPPLCKAVCQGHLQGAQTSAHLSVLLAVCQQGQRRPPSPKGTLFPSWLPENTHWWLYFTYQSSSVSFGALLPNFESVLRFPLFLNLFPGWPHLLSRLSVPRICSHLPHSYFHVGTYLPSTWQFYLGVWQVLQHSQTEHYFFPSKSGDLAPCMAQSQP